MGSGVLSYSYSLICVPHAGRTLKLAGGIVHFNHIISGSTTQQLNPSLIVLHGP